ncbi:MAG: deoxynucleoside kinase [Bacteroidetes bacterium]|nr:deoxynucleoside kinase [Bacteroidota bacterium]
MKQLYPYSYIVIEGNIGAGKTSLAKILANKYNTDLVLEQFADNTFYLNFTSNPIDLHFHLKCHFWLKDTAK